MKPNKAQRMAKARMYKWLAEHTEIDMDNMTIQAQSSASKATNLGEWLGKEGFADWWWEKDTVLTKVVAGVEIAVERLLDIIETPKEDIGPRATVSTKDILAAADKLFQLADLYPKKKVVEKFLDKQLESMDAEETTAELKRMESKLVTPKEKDLTY